MTCRAPTRASGRRSLNTLLIGTRPARSARAFLFLVGKRPEFETPRHFRPLRLPAHMAVVLIERDQIGVRFLIADQHDEIVNQDGDEAGPLGLLKGPSGILHRSRPSAL